ncbi:hypothetical protein FRB94_005815 [Tulasnella sp. JGI-2019a]|nr:hypothetical protein FRB93_011435 [Tulasnella sp. JGI-2019a]KAG9012498.1 hypothetical protein FRB94_005815 [Tulasnella sp. JGI-2019a]KAG9036614.1 hypothetical protein FRB95_008448 [Tulasnella sp. JGI-2019a]
MGGKTGFDVTVLTGPPTTTSLLLAKALRKSDLAAEGCEATILDSQKPRPAQIHPSVLKSLSEDRLATMSSARRSPRNHKETSNPSNSRVKAASIRWTDTDSALEQILISALESNKRWRFGLFSSDSVTTFKTRCHDEIARFLFATHLHFAEAYHLKPGAFARAVRDRVETLSDALAVAALQKARTRSSKARVSADLYSLRLRQSEIWTKHRQSQQWDSAQWQPRFPLEIQLLILHSFIENDPEPVEQICQDDNPAPPPSKTRPFTKEKLIPSASSPSHAQIDRNLNHPRAAIACMVNHFWYDETVRSLYTTVTLQKPSHFENLFGGHGAMHQGRAGEFTQVLTLHAPPQNAIQLCAHRSTVPYVQFDFGSSKSFFTRLDEDTGKPIEELGRTPQRIGALATRSVPLYQLTLCLEATKLRLFVSETNPVDSTDDIWQDLIAGHVAALRMMTHLEHLIIDAELYLILLPTYFKAWCQTDLWRQVLLALKSEASAKPMATFFDDTHLKTLTFVGSHIPTLAFLARISCAPRVKNINLVGWNQPGIDEDWSNFVKEGRSMRDPMCNWVAEDVKEL